MKFSPLFAVVLSVATCDTTVRANSAGNHRGAPAVSAAAELCTLPCQNGGSCEYVLEDATGSAATGDDFFPVVDSTPDYGPMYCHCPVMWTGSLCEAENRNDNGDNGEQNPKNSGDGDLTIHESSNSSSNNNIDIDEALCVGDNNPCENGSSCSVANTTSKLSCDCSVIPTALGIFDGKYCQNRAKEVCVLSGLAQGERPESFCVHGSCKRFVLTPRDG